MTFGKVYGECLVEVYVAFVFEVPIYVCIYIYIFLRVGRKNATEQ